ncbi:MAG: LVIVD repeat-containing protein [Nitrospiria bacterium]
MNNIKTMAVILCLSGVLSGCGGGGGDSAKSLPSSGKSDGATGSLARITLVNNHLYLLAGSTLKTVSIRDAAHPVPVNTLELNPDIETLYPHGAALLVGGQNGVTVIDISAPDDPRFLSSYSHQWQCDPVVAEGSTAYVTLRTGRRCWFGDNRLDILDISNLKAPRLIQSYSMINPHGLAVNGNILFVAEGDFGFKVFDVTDPENIIRINNVRGILAEDIILVGGRVYLIGRNGLYQYNFFLDGQIDFLSHIPVLR